MAIFGTNDPLVVVDFGVSIRLRIDNVGLGQGGSKAAQQEADGKHTSNPVVHDKSFLSIGEVRGMALHTAKKTDERVATGNRWPPCVMGWVRLQDDSGEVPGSSLACR